MLKAAKPHIGEEAAYMLRSAWPAARLFMQQAVAVAALLMALFWAGELVLTPPLLLRRAVRGWWLARRSGARHGKAPSRSNADSSPSGDSDAEPAS